MKSSILLSLLTIIVVAIIVVSSLGCAQIGMPTGGPRDTIPPKLVKATPANNSTNFQGNKITLSFDEYVNVVDVINNVIVSPLQKNNPAVDYKLRTVTVRLKDTLLPNTTYSINFGDAIKDNNEGNPMRNFTYVFSTGNTIDSLEQPGKVVIAENGKVDSSLIVLLYRSNDDSAVQKRKPDYIAKLDGKGNFRFKNLSAGTYKIYALKDGDGGKTYNSKYELFAFADRDISVSASNEPVTLYASAEEKDNRTAIAANIASAFNKDKRLRYTSVSTPLAQELTDPLELNFNKPLRTIDTTKLFLFDSSKNRITAYSVSLDSTKKIFKLSASWKEEMKYRLIIDKAAFTDTSNNNLAKTDTIRISTKKISDYGNVVLRFTNLDLSKHPVLLLVSAEAIKYSFPLTSSEWRKGLIKPGEYEIRILFDENQNGKWDAGKYSLKRQPEKVTTLLQKLNVKGDWDNEQDIRL